MRCNIVTSEIFDRRGRLDGGLRRGRLVVPDLRRWWSLCPSLLCTFVIVGLYMVCRYLLVTIKYRISERALCDCLARAQNG